MHLPIATFTTSQIKQSNDNRQSVKQTTGNRHLGVVFIKIRSVQSGRAIEESSDNLASTGDVDAEWFVSGIGFDLDLDGGTQQIEKFR